jgi:hypothetical protein
MRFTRVKSHDDALMLEIDLHVLNAFDFHERRSQLADALIAIFAFRGDFDRFQNYVVGPFGIERVSRVGIFWSCRVHRFLFFLSNVRRRRNGRLLSSRTK